MRTTPSVVADGRGQPRPLPVAAGAAPRRARAAAGRATARLQHRRAPGAVRASQAPGRAARGDRAAPPPLRRAGRTNPEDHQGRNGSGSPSMSGRPDRCRPPAGPGLEVAGALPAKLHEVEARMADLATIRDTCVPRSTPGATTCTGARAVTAAHCPTSRSPPERATSEREDERPSVRWRRGCRPRAEGVPAPNTPESPSGPGGKPRGSALRPSGRLSRLCRGSVGRGGLRRLTKDQAPSSRGARSVSPER